MEMKMEKKISRDRAERNSNSRVIQHQGSVCSLGFLGVGSSPWNDS